VFHSFPKRLPKNRRSRSIPQLGFHARSVVFRLQVSLSSSPRRYPLASSTRLTGLSCFFFCSYRLLAEPVEIDCDYDLITRELKGGPNECPSNAPPPSCTSIVPVKRSRRADTATLVPSKRGSGRGRRRGGCRSKSRWVCLLRLDKCLCLDAVSALPASLL
jgi:hypothetical protein